VAKTIEASLAARLFLRLEYLAQKRERRVQAGGCEARHPTRGREQLRKLFEGGRLLVHPQPDGTYITESRFFPLKLLSLALDGAKQEAREPSSDVSPGFSPDLLSTRLNSACSSDGCAGRI
jgi:hypothetical protein